MWTKHSSRCISNTTPARLFFPQPCHWLSHNPFLKTIIYSKYDTLFHKAQYCFTRTVSKDFWTLKSSKAIYLIFKDRKVLLWLTLVLTYKSVAFDLLIRRFCFDFSTLGRCLSGFKCAHTPFFHDTYVTHNFWVN